MILERFRPDGPVLGMASPDLLTGDRTLFGRAQNQAFNFGTISQSFHDFPSGFIAAQYAHVIFKGVF